MDELTRMEESLRESLRHVSAPEGFADRVMVRVKQHDAGRARTSRRVLEMPSRYAGWLAAAAALILAVGGGETLHIRHQRQAQAAAQAQVDRAMQLTSHAMIEVETGFERSPAGRYAKLWKVQ